MPLYIDGQENHANVSSHVALTGEIVNIHDVYTCEDFDFSGTRKYDQATGYRSKSMLVIPMRNHENDIIGVLQLLNALDQSTQAILEFQDEVVALVASLASQAAVTLTKTRLIRNLTDLLNAFIQSIASAIEEKSRYTGGHIFRVSRLAIMLAQKINEEDRGPFQDLIFSPQELEELRIAAWLHDIGKIVTPEYVVDKSSKLETIFDRIQLVEMRLDCIALQLEADSLKRRLARSEAGLPPDPDEAKTLHDALDAIEKDRAFIAECNHPGEYLSDQSVERLEVIARKTFLHKGELRPWLTDNELENLCIRKGTLTAQERTVIENHVKVTYKMLSRLPFPKNLDRVPDIASQHHEKLDGAGYPFGLKGEQLSLQARILAVADIFEALTAKDRPYKQPMRLSQAVAILGKMKEQGVIDAHVHDLLIETDVLHIYAKEELNPEQVDIELPVEAQRRQLNSLEMEIARLLDTPPPIPSAAKQRPGILVVDDSVNNRMLLQYYLNQSPYDVCLAHSGVEGLRRYIADDIDLLLVDMEMHQFSGRDMARAIREWESRHRVAPRLIVAMTASYYRDSPIDDVGVTSKISRPFSREALLRCIEDALSGREPTEPDENDR